MSGEYQPPVLVKFLHSFPHLDFTFKKLNSSHFNPDSQLYVEVSSTFLLNMNTSTAHCGLNRLLNNDHVYFAVSTVLGVRTNSVVAIVPTAISRVLLLPLLPARCGDEAAHAMSHVDIGHLSSSHLVSTVLFNKWLVNNNQVSIL